MDARDIKENIPVHSSFTLLKSIEFERIDNTSILWSSNFVSKIGFLQNLDSVEVVWFHCTAFRIVKKNSWRAILKSTPKQVSFGIRILSALFFTV